MNDNFEAASVNDLKELNIRESPIIPYLEEYLPEILKILKQSEGQVIESMIGVQQYSFGTARLKLLDIVNLSLNFTEDTKIMEIMREQRVAAVLLVSSNQRQRCVFIKEFII